MIPRAECFRYVMPSGQRLQNEISFLIKEATGELPHPFCSVRTQLEGTNMERGIPICSFFDHGILSRLHYEKLISVAYKLPNFYYSVKQLKQVKTIGPCVFFQLIICMLI